MFLFADYRTFQNDHATATNSALSYYTNLASKSAEMSATKSLLSWLLHI